MPKTYEPIASYTLASTSTGITFSSIPATYTDLILTLNLKGSLGTIPAIRINSDTGNNYSCIDLKGNGSAASSSKTTNNDFMFTTNVTSYSATEFVFNEIIHFFNYANTSTYKTVLSRANDGTSGTEAFINSWKSTAAINTILVYPYAGNFSIGCTLTLYGIKAA